MIRSMMSFTKLPLSFWGYALETAARLLNIAPSKTVAQRPYHIWHGKPASYKYLRVWGSPAYIKRLVGDKLDSSSSLCRNAVFLERGFPTDTRRDELLLEESSEAPQSNAGTSSAPDVSTDNVPILRRSARVPQPPERYGYLGVIGQEDNDHKTYREAMTKDVFLVYGGGELILEDFSDASFPSDDDDAKSQSGFVFKLNSSVVAWKSSKQDTTADSTTKAEYIVALETAKETVWMKNYIQELGVVPRIPEPVVIFCDNNGAIVQAKEPRSHHRSKHILR
ncbi:UNVERIFIED_CONTAM: Retrovirus-related Pol polyprotein from transposon TNT 1-94 [Sesamum radiatum]|uniref:Retrovirus-related Pol polyprotein from transposon TNT 1-94 n=1 Tax=Sesamum radiatum TaxID=300843 RepID=A0AAW2K5C5_SESRA